MDLSPRNYIEPAQAAADACGEDWKERAEELFCWVLEKADKPLLSEVVASVAYGMGLPRPREPRAWGGITLALSRRKEIQPGPPERDHRGSFKTTWIRARRAA
jgi:hypothetical protein